MRALSILVLSAVAACGCEDEPVGASGVAPSKPVNGLSDADARRLCDWLAGQTGGYGAAGGCGYVNVPPSRGDCVAALASCAALVRPVEGCAQKLASAGTTACSQAVLDDIPAFPDCQAATPGCF
jgi:hypothetical protein